MIYEGDQGAGNQGKTSSRQICREKKRKNWRGPNIFPLYNARIDLLLIVEGMGSLAHPRVLTFGNLLKGLEKCSGLRKLLHASSYIHVDTFIPNNIGTHISTSTIRIDTIYDTGIDIL